MMKQVIVGEDDDNEGCKGLGPQGFDNMKKFMCLQKVRE